VLVDGTGKTKSGNELGGRSVWLYKVNDGKLNGASSSATPRRRAMRWLTCLRNSVISKRLVPTPCAGSPAVIAIRSPGLGDP